MPKLAPHLATIPASQIRLLTEQAWKIDDVMMLSVGEPDVAVDPEVLKAGAQTWLEDDTDYTENRGILPLREAIAKDLKRRLDVDIDLDRLCVTHGGTQAIWLATCLALGEGDEVLVPNPGYTIFNMAPILEGATAVSYELRATDGFLPTVAQLESLITEHTRAIILNSPSNPLGIVMPKQLVSELMEFARKHDLWVISDEVYEGFTYDNEFVSPLQFDTDGRVLAAHSFSKSYAMTGIRVGYLVTPSGIGDRVDAVQETSVSCINVPAQRAALKALEIGDGPIRAAAEHYAQNAKLACEVLDELGLEYLPPTGAFYLWANVSHVSNGNVFDWAMNFLREQKVAVAPGSAFGSGGEGWIRICLSTESDTLVTALRRLPAKPKSV